MKVAGYAAMFASGAFCASDFLPGPDMIQYSALAILGWVVWYLLARALPAHIRAQKDDREAFLQAQREERQAYLAAQDVTRREFRESLAGMAHSLDCMAVVIAETRRADGSS